MIWIESKKKIQMKFSITQEGNLIGCIIVLTYLEKKFIIFVRHARPKCFSKGDRD